jgi:hypothetical protein
MVGRDALLRVRIRLTASLHCIVGKIPKTTRTGRAGPTADARERIPTGDSG